MKLTKMMVAGIALAMASYSFAGQVSSDGVRNMTDPRDGKTYKTVKIGNQVWMAENLNVNIDGSDCYEEKPENCDKYGRLYSFADAKKACPQGWHLPTKMDFKKLADTRVFSEILSGMYSSGEGEDNFSGMNVSSYYWTADTEWKSGYDVNVPVFWSVSKKPKSDEFNTYVESYIEASVRCIKDADVTSLLATANSDPVGMVFGEWQKKQNFYSNNGFEKPGTFLEIGFSLKKHLDDFEFVEISDTNGSTVSRGIAAKLKHELNGCPKGFSFVVTSKNENPKEYAGQKIQRLYSCDVKHPEINMGKDEYADVMDYCYNESEKSFENICPVPGFYTNAVDAADISYKKNNALFVSGGWFGEPKSFNPIQESWLNAWPVGGNSNLMYEPLIVLNSLTGEIEPLLGTYRPELSNDDYIVVDVNPSAKWSDGRTVTAEDVIYSFRNKPSPMIDSIGVSESTQDAERLSFYVANGAGVNRVLNYLRIVKIIPKHVFGKLVETYGMDEVKKAPFDKIPFTMGSSPIVSGPYNLKEYDANKIVLERRDEYWGNAALHEGNKPVPRYIVHLNSFYGEIGLNGLRDGRINVSTTYIPDRVMKQKNNKIHGWGKTYYQLPSTVSMLVVNATKEPLNNRYFRRAMAAAIDYNSLTKLAGLDHYTQPLQQGLIIPNLMESKYIDKRDQENYGISTQLSKEERESLVRSLLDSAGIITVGEKKGSLSYMKLKNGKKIKPLKIIAPAAWTDWMIMVEAVVADMRELGIDVHVEQVDGGEYWKKLGLGDFDLIMHKPADIAPWNRFFEVMSSKEWQPIGSWAGWNVGRYNNPNSSGYRFEVDAFLTELLSTRDDKKKKECYRRLNQIFMEDMPAIPLVYFPEEYYWYEESAWNGWSSENDPYAPPFNLGSGSGTNVLWHLKSSL